MLALLCACGGGQRAQRDPCAGTIELRGQHDLDAMRSCRRVTGDLVLATGAELDLAPLASLTAIDGALRIGPTLAITVIDGLSGLERVGGDVVIEANGLVTSGFFPSLRHVGGSIEVLHNGSLAGLALPALRRVDGDLTFVANPALERLDLPALRHLGGTMRLRGNRALYSIRAPVLEHVAAVRVDESGSVPAEQLEWLRARAPR